MRLALPLTLRCDAIGITLKEVIDGCRDRILSPYLIHSRHQKQPKPMSKDNLSDYFAKARDLAGIIPPAGKTPPTFHEQRSLSERLYRAQGIDTKTLLGHKVRATTDRYNDTRGQEWVKLVITRMIGRLLRGGFMTAIYAYLYIPIIILIVNSFNSSRFGINWQGFTTKWYSLLMNNDSLLQAAQHSLTMAVFSATFATLIGSLTAVALYRYRFRGKPFVSGMLFVVMMSPDIVMAISLLVLFMLLGIQLGFWSLLFSHITFCLPFVVVTVYSRLKGFDVRMLEAAKDLGASEFTILRKIILPLAIPAVAAGWVLSFTLSMDDVVVSSFVTGPSYEILPLKIYSMVKVGVSPEVNALATILLVLSLVMVIASQLIARDKTKGNTGDVK